MSGKGGGIMKGGMLFLKLIVAFAPFFPLLASSPLFFFCCSSPFSFYFLPLLSPSAFCFFLVRLVSCLQICRVLLPFISLVFDLYE